MRLETGTPKILDWKFDYSRAPCLGSDQKARGLWERDCALCFHFPANHKTPHHLSDLPSCSYRCKFFHLHRSQLYTSKDTSQAGSDKWRYHDILDLYTRQCLSRKFKTFIREVSNYVFSLIKIKSYF